MYSIKVLGEVPASMAQLRAVVKAIPEQCHMSWTRHTFAEPETAWEGELLDVPNGTHHIWQQADKPYDCLLIRTHGELILGSLVLYTYDLPRHALDRLPGHVWNGLREMLKSSERRVAVYMAPNDFTRTYEYMFLWPMDEPPATHKQHPDKEFIGFADLETGVIKKD